MVCGADVTVSQSCESYDRPIKSRCVLRAKFVAAIGGGINHLIDACVDNTLVARICDSSFLARSLPQANSVANITVIVCECQPKLIKVFVVTLIAVSQDLAHVPASWCNSQRAILRILRKFIHQRQFRLMYASVPLYEHITHRFDAITQRPIVVGHIVALAEPNACLEVRRKYDKDAKLQDHSSSVKEPLNLCYVFGIVFGH